MLYIIAAIYGLLIGNYSTTAYFRIPRAMPINGLSTYSGKAPHCSTCSHPLKFYEYFPVFSWVFTRFKCNYCGAPTNKAYTILEATVMFSSILLFTYLGMTTIYVTSVLIASAITLNLSLFITHHKFFRKALYIFFVSILLWGITLI